MRLYDSLRAKGQSLVVPRLYDSYALDYGKPPQPALDYASSGTQGGIDYTAPTGPGYGLPPVSSYAQAPVAAPAASPAQTPSGLPGSIDALKAALVARGSLAPPVPSQPADLNTSQALIPLGIGLLGKLFGASDKGVENAVSMAWQGFHQRAVDAARQKDLLAQQEYQRKTGELGANVDIAQLQYQAAQGDKAAQDKLDQITLQSNLDTQGKVAVQNAKDQAAMDRLNASLSGATDQAKAKVMGTYEAGLSMGMSQEQAAAYAMSEHYKDIASGNLDTTKAQDIEATRAARIDAIQQAAHVDKAHAALYEKEYDSFDTDRAIKLAMLKAQVDSLGLTVQGKKYDNSPFKLEYDNLSHEYERLNGELKTWQAQSKQASDVLNDPKKAFMLEPAEKERLVQGKAQADAKVAGLLKQVEDIGSQMSGLSKKLSGQAATGGSRPPSMPGGIPDKNTAPPGLGGNAGGMFAALFGNG